MDIFWNIMNIVKQYISSYTGFAGKMQTLKRKRDTLWSLEADITDQLKREESSSSKKRRKVVEDLLGNMEKIRNKVESMEEVSAISGFLGSVKLSNRVEDLTKYVDELMEQGQFWQGLGLTLDAHDDVELLAPKLVGQAFQRNLETIWEHLKKDEILSIGVWGMGGAGKTTLVAHVYNRIKKQSGTFEHVYWITVSQNPSVRKLQDDIAKAIDFDISFEDNERIRAAILSRELMKRTRSVLILDDVWNGICLESVGIALAVNGYKLLITTRSLDVCRILRCEEKVEVKKLSEVEAWDLFEKTLGHSKMVLSADVLKVAERVAQECAGLPLGIITLASSMREVEDIREWRNVLRELKESECALMEEKVFKVLELSYNRLHDPKVQQCFLYCALFPEDVEIEREELIQYFIDEGLIGKMKDRQEQFDRGHDTLKTLVNSCLLEVVAERELRVKMHDLVRDMAIKITGPQFMVKAGMRLEEIPEEHEWSRDVERVSLVDNNIREVASTTSPRCPKLVTLFLSYNLSLKRIENSFFEHMPVLQVLNLSFCKEIEELPDSISNLKNLSALVLYGCQKLQHMPSLAEVTSLKRLVLHWSGIREIPHGLEMLVNLSYLDLTDTKKLEVFPSGILPKLSRLEYLKFDVIWSRVKIKGEELKGLKRLSTFQGCLIFDDKVNGFKEYFMSRWKYAETSCSYEFHLDDGKYVAKSYNRRCNLNEVRLRNWSMSRIREEDGNIEFLETLLKDVQSLEMDGCNDAGSLSDVWWLDNVTKDLKRCSIFNCGGLKSVGSFSSSPLFFQTLEILNLHLLELRILFEMEGEGGGPVPPPSLPHAVFPCLKSLNISLCHNMKKLFQPGFLPYLQNLEQIDVSDCDGLEEIIASTANKEEEEEEEEEEGMSSSNNNTTYHSYSDVEYSLPKLKTLSLRRLPKLKRICEGTLACDVLEEIEVKFCPLLQRIPMSQPPTPFKSIKVYKENGEEWWESLKWDDPDANNLFRPYLNFCLHPWAVSRNASLF